MIMSALRTTFFEETWKKRMNELLEKAKSDPVSYTKFINELERRFKEGSQEAENLVRSYVENLRRVLWPRAQFEKEALLARKVISSETFDLLRQLSNYEKFVAHYKPATENLLPTMVPTIDK